MKSTLKCIDLTRQVSEIFSLQSINLELFSGDNVALIGPNGAGKTTFFELITGNSDATGGEIQLNGQKFRPEFFALKKDMGYLSQDISLPLWVSPKELLAYSASLHGIANKKSAIDEQIALWQIEPYLNRPIASCSHGMKKRAGLAIALLHDPGLLILDEPFAGLDILHISSLKKVIKSRHENGRTSIVSTHILPYASELCNRAFTIKSGLIAEIQSWKDTPRDLQQKIVEDHFKLGLEQQNEQ